MIILGLGSSIEPKKQYLDEALKKIEKNPHLQIKKRSKIYLTEAWGGVAKNTFLNMCIVVDYCSSPYELLKILHEIEYDLSRKRDIHWSDRTIDIDILFFNDISIDDDILTVPHKYITDRNFVLYPLYDVAGDIVYKGKKLSLWCEENEDFIEVYCE